MEKLFPTTKREINFELLRIIAMLMIVSLHYWGKSGFTDSAEISTPGFFLAWIVRSCCYCAVNCYILLSGYFMSGGKFKMSKAIKIWLQVFEYSFLIYLFTCLAGINTFSVSSLIKCFLPITMEEYWFVTKYLLLLFLSPFLNVYIERCDRRQLGLTCIVSLILFSVLPTVFCYNDYTNIVDGYSLLWFVTLYLVAAYVRIYGLEYIESKQNCLIGYGVNASILLLSKVVIYLLSSHFLGKAIYSNLLFRYNVFFVFMSSLFLFGFFRNITIKSVVVGRVVAIFAPATFGVYLIHLAPSLKDWLWKEVINPVRFNNVLVLLVNYLVVVLCVFLICSFLEMLRQRILEKSRIVQACFNIIDKKYNYLSEKLMEKLDS